jgi:hypothetical protein
MAPSIFQPLATLANKAKRPRRKTLTAALSEAQRINPPPSSDAHEDCTNKFRQLVRYKADGDGLWKCCHGHEQELIHWSGAHPFKHLTCNRCDHILCEQCCTTDVIVVVQAEQDGTLPLFLPVGDVIHFGQVCPFCGLSHRAVLAENSSTLSFNNVECECTFGYSSYNSWLKFRIGSIEGYRRNPHDAFAELSWQRAEKSVYVHRRGSGSSELSPTSSSNSLTGSLGLARGKLHVTNNTDTIDDSAEATPSSSVDNIAPVKEDL